MPRTGLALVHQGEKIIPAARNVGSAGSVVITQNIHVDSRSDVASVYAAMASAKNAAVREIRAELANNWR